MAHIDVLQNNSKQIIKKILERYERGIEGSRDKYNKRDMV